jgi:tetratricopeptide (TPR) repeat protein
MRRAGWLLGFILALPGCVYYNGMYNANRLARAAEKAEREGRTFEANSLWGQVGVKADTVLARHSDSKWADNARLLRGKSYQRLGDCNSAVTVLRELLVTSSDSLLTEEGAFLLGRCYQTLGNAEEASYAFQRLVNSADPARRKEALYHYGRSLRMGGRYPEALEFLSRSDDPRSAGERAAALAGIGRIDESIVVAESLIVAGDTTAPWDSLLALIGRQDMPRASALTDRLITSLPSTPVQQAGWAYADGERLIRVDPPAGERRLNQSIQLSSDGPFAAHSRLLFLRIRMARLESIDSLRAIRTDLDDMLQSGGSTGLQLGRYMRISSMVLDAADSVTAGGSSPDLRLFLAAELTRDSLEMPRLASVLWQRIVSEYQASPYAAKAWLALGALDSSSADSTEAVLTTRYPDNPYYLASRGEDAPGFAALEDSLFQFAMVMRRAIRATTPTRQQAPASPSTRLPEN